MYQIFNNENQQNLNPRKQKQVAKSILKTKLRKKKSDSIK